MGTAAVEWSGLNLVFAASFVAVAIAVWRIYAAARKRARTRETSPVELSDLLLKRDMLVRKLRESEDETAAEPTPEQLARERDGRELEEILHELDRRRPSGGTSRRQGGAGRAPGSVFADNARWRGFVGGTVSTAAVGLLLFLGYSFLHSKERRGSVLARTAVAGADGAGSPAAPGREAQLKTAVARNPEDVQARLELARLYLIKEDWRPAFDQTREVLKRSPEEARALTYLGVIRFNAGQPDVAIALFQRAIAKKPDLLEPYLQLALVYFRLDREPEADGTLASASRRFPDKADMLRGLIVKWRQQAGEQAAASARPSAGAPTNR
jgi:Tfp pilus assembly protein PilF